MFVLLGLCPDWEDWTPKNATNNAKDAMDAAEQWLDVPQVSYLKQIKNSTNFCLTQISLK